MAEVLLFSYGTLQDPAVQIAHFGRTLVGTSDGLERFVRTGIALDGDLWPILIPSEGEPV